MVPDEEANRALARRNTGLRHWKIRRELDRELILVFAFSTVFLFVLWAILGLFQNYPHPNPDAFNARGMSLVTYGLGFLGYILRKSYVSLGWRYYLRKSDTDFHLFPEVRAVFLELIHLKLVKVLFWFGIAYTILMLILWKLNV